MVYFSISVFSVFFGRIVLVAMATSAGKGLHWADWLIIALYFVFTISIGLVVSSLYFYEKLSGKSIYFRSEEISFASEHSEANIIYVFIYIFLGGLGVGGGGGGRGCVFGLEV